MKVIEEFIYEAMKNVSTIDELRGLKSKFSLKHKIPFYTNVSLIEAYKNMISEGKVLYEVRFWRLLRKRGVRSQSGIASVTVITKPFKCPGNCIFCPTEPKMPKSYLSDEPAIMRAIMNKFSPYGQTVSRISGLEKTGHFTDKIDLIVSGGTFSYYPKRYRTTFVREIFNALNHPKNKEKSIIAAQTENESAKHRCIGLSFETRPDFVSEEEVKYLRRLGATRVELGVQSLNDKVLALNNRGHGVEDTKRAIRLLKDAGLKVNCHMMPNLYGSDMKNDIEDFAKLFADSSFRPDWLKIYPCMVVPWSKLEKIYERGQYIPYSDKDLINLLMEIKQMIPRYVRITRLYRDIPAPLILGGSKVSNIRQEIQKIMKDRGLRCDCIRCREIKDEAIDGDKLKMNIYEYDASDGKEFFISYDDEEKDKLCSLLRLRFHSYGLRGHNHFIKELNGAALIREVHTYGEQIRIKRREGDASQHIGLGRKMIHKAEEISKSHGFESIAVISGIGVREYYKKLGYRLEGTYMIKALR